MFKRSILMGPEGHDTGPKIARMEWNVERDGGKSTLQDDVTIFRFFLLMGGPDAAASDFLEHFLGLIDGESLCGL